MKSNGIKNNHFKKPNIPSSAQKKEWFNFDVYSSGHVINRNTGKFTIFKVRTRERIVNKKKYTSVEKKAPIYINHNGIKKTIQISHAKLIAILFVPNPERYKNVRYKQGGRFNCDANNLEWSDLSPNANRIKVLPKALNKIYDKINPEELHHSCKSAYLYYTTKEIKYLYDFFKLEKRYFGKVMETEWERHTKSKPNFGIIYDDIYRSFIDNVPSLIERGFFIPKKYWFLLYCRNHLKGMIANFICRKSPKQKKLNELYMPKHLIKL